MGYIYKIVHIPTGNYYIGKRCSFKDYDSYLGSGRCWKNFIKDKPREEFRKEILAIENDKNKLSDLEIHFIGDFWKIDHFSKGGHCYNCSSGGDGGFGHTVVTEEKRRKLSIAAKRQWANMTEEERQHMSRKGKKHSEETKRKISKSCLGRPSPNKGKTPWNKGKTGYMSKQGRENISKARKRILTGRPIHNIFSEALE